MKLKVVHVMTTFVTEENVFFFIKVRFRDTSELVFTVF